MPSKAYDRAVVEATRHHARSKTYSGKFLRPHKPWLLEIIRERGINSALDYGCGKGSQYTWVDPEDGKTLEEAFGFEVRKFDPAWPPFAAEPEPGRVWDLVICTHVLGSIPLPDMDWVLDRIYGAAGQAVYIAEKIGDVGKTALSRPELRPVGLTALDWLVTLAEKMDRQVPTYFSARESTPTGARTRRWRIDAGSAEAECVFDTEEKAR